MYDETVVNDDPPAARRRRRMPVVRMILAIVAVLAATGVYAAWTGLPRKPAFHGTSFDPVSAAPPFHLTGTDGRAVTLDTFRGTPVVLFFGYTRCPDVCPLTLQRLSRIIRTLPADARAPRIVFVTVDPAHDTPVVLREYLRHFGAVGLTGDSASLAQAWRGYSVYVAPNDAPSAPPMQHAGHGMRMAAPGSAAPAALIHSGAVYAIDRNGRLRAIISDTETDDERRDDLRTLAAL